MVAGAPIVTVETDEVPVAAAVLARDFATDPVAEYLFPEGAERARLAPLLFRGAFRRRRPDQRAPLLGIATTSGE
jgi:hypothetical protein